MSVLFLCTGNAARSVMAESFFRRLAPEWPVASAGTLAIDGLPTSVRTSAALAALGYDAIGHRSRQVENADFAGAELVAVFEPYHLSYVHRNHPEAADRTASLPRLARHLPPGPEPIGERVASMGLDRITFEAWEEVPDPAGGTAEVFVDSATVIHALVGNLVARLGPPPRFADPPAERQHRAG